MDLDTNIRALLALNRITCAHPRYGRLLVEHFGSAQAAVEVAGESSALAAGIPARPAASIGKESRRDIARQLEKDLQWLASDNHFVVSHDDPEYPALLREIHDPPLVLFCDGDKRVLDSLKFAMVGSRDPTRGGQKCARDFARRLASAGVTVTSGLAIGIDGASHEGALEGGGPTIAVLGTGCDVIYPGRHRKMADAVRNNGLLISEFPLGTTAIPANFPQRNRIVTGLSLGTLVVQAALKSGSLISARLAMEQGREVFAIPGPIGDRQSRGCHQLIKQGAKLTESLEDIEEELGGIIQFELESPEAIEVTELQGRLLEVMGQEPLHVDALTAQTGMPVADVSSALIQLEIMGAVERRSDGFVLASVPVRVV